MDIPYAHKVDVRLEATGEHIEGIVEVWVSIAISELQSGFDPEKFSELTSALDDLLALASVDRVIVHSQPTAKTTQPQFGKY